VHKSWLLIYSQFMMHGQKNIELLRVLMASTLKGWVF